MRYFATPIGNRRQPGRPGRRIFEMEYGPMEVPMTVRSQPRRGFTIVEVLVVISVVILLVGILLPALRAFRKTGLMTKSRGNMRQIGTWMPLYAGDNHDTVVPSRFNYKSHPGKVRSVVTIGFGERNRGTWTDILWTVYQVGLFPEALGKASNGTP